MVYTCILMFISRLMNCILVIHHRSIWWFTFVICTWLITWLGNLRFLPHLNFICCVQQIIFRNSFNQMTYFISAPITKEFYFWQSMFQGCLVKNKTNFLYYSRKSMQYRSKRILGLLVPITISISPTWSRLL